MGRLQEKAVVITGGTQGIGVAMAKLFASEGAHVFITGRRQKEREQVVASTGSNVTGIQGDVRTWPTSIEPLDVRVEGLCCRPECSGP